MKRCTNKKETFAYEISLRNTKKDAVEVLMQDQVPLSSDKEITIELMESSGAIYDEESGKLTWRVNLAPSETKKFRLIFSVKYPKNKSIQNL